MSTSNQSRIGCRYKKLSIYQKRKVISLKKRHGDGIDIANRMGYSATHVSNVLSGQCDNVRIINFAYNKVRGRKTS